MTYDHVQILKRFSQDKWKFLVCVAVLEVNNAVTVENLENFFDAFPTAEEVACSWYYDITKYNERLGPKGGDFLSRCIVRTSFDFIDAPFDDFPFSPEFISEYFTRDDESKNKFWIRCYEAVFAAR